MNEVFHCNVCSKYKPIESRCSDLPCCEKCRGVLLADDVAKNTKAVKEKKVISHALKLKIKRDARTYQRELRRAISDEWMI